MCVCVLNDATSAIGALSALLQVRECESECGAYVKLEEEW